MYAGGDGAERLPVGSSYPLDRRRLKLPYIHADVSALRFDDVIVFGTGQGWRLGQCEVRYKWGLILTNVALACYLMLVLLFFILLPPEVPPQVL